ncbi:MAG: carotenoid oxygenase family protein [Ilumatobacter sp.]|uniref:carotenoid oxygenase family protein n=1 Tax=Ilumatobacter sp. TaxID=1967498 RepID=UPI00261A1B35|nr:carotenoid oxygenase family protein [Ilumatobacter sp.]MDJ0767854.1 carotenoid oxygenase family protein [Ilumatobacter sp.]
MTSKWVTGTKAPVHDELDVADLEVTGALPPSLSGRLVRMGPNPIGPVADEHHWFAGAGMVHAIDLDGGRATRFVNRWVRTVPVSDELGEETALAPVTSGADIANTSALHIAGQLLALTETCPPYRLDADLATLGREDFGAGVEHFTAHPHTDPATGEVLAVGYAADDDPSCTLYTIGGDGRLASQRRIDLLGPRSVHDMAFTPDHAVVWDLPLEMVHEGADPDVPFRWNREGAARVGLVDRHDAGAPVRWYDIEPCWVFHPVNAYETDHGVVVDVCQFDRIFDVDPTGPGDPFPPQLWRWTLDRDAAEVKRELIDDRIQEFPRIDERRWGSPARFGYTVELFSRHHSAAILAHDLQTGGSAHWAADDGHALGEAVFVPDADDAGEGEGWLLAIDSTPDRSDLVVLDATDVAAGPVARVHLPQRIPDGFHGDFY